MANITPLAKTASLPSTTRVVLPGPTVPRPTATRLVSLDALRGFSMFCLLGGGEILRAVTVNSPENSFGGFLRAQFAHVPWEGFRFYDFIFPLFLFCIGVAVPISTANRLAAGDSKARILRRSLVRLGWMIFFGWWVNGRILTWDFSQMTLSYSVLMMLGFGYIIAVILVLYCTLRTQILITAGILLAYWGVQMGIRVPGATGAFVPGGIFSDWLYDQTIGQSGPPWYSRYGRGWPVTLWNHGATAMLGVFASYILVRGDDRRAIRTLLLGGIVLLLLGWVWSLHLPIVKNRWTSSYVLFCGGLSWMLLGGFQFVLASLGWRKWAGLFIIIGSNSILAYLINAKFMGPFESVIKVLFGGLHRWLGDYWHPVFMTTASYGLAWLLLAYLYRRRLFLRL